jgi:uncharacterized protein (DUF58 family)
VYRFLKSLYLAPRLFMALGAVLLLFVLGFFFTIFLALARAGLVAIVLLLLVDLLLLYRKPRGIVAHRMTPEKLSNGDPNDLRIHIENHYGFPVGIRIIDEIPFQFQVRDFGIDLSLPTDATRIVTYLLRPVKRGEYDFGDLNIYASSPIGFAQRRFILPERATVPVYPSFLQMRRYELLAISNRLTEVGIKKVRKIGHTLEFDQIREYVPGDDYRTINWNATARKSTVMVNQYEDEKSQQVYSIIDKGRVMKMPFEGMSLLDYAINASLVLSNIAIRKDDKGGLVTFSDRMGTFIPAERKRSQMFSIMEALYGQETDFKESSYEALHAGIKGRIRQRSLVFLYTNFETLSSLQRQIPYLRAIARDHLLVVIFFENTELKSLLRKPARTTEEIYIKAVAEKFAFEKKRIVKELSKHGILSILTPPEGLTVNTINKYFELKARRAI